MSNVARDRAFEAYRDRMERVSPGLFTDALKEYFVAGWDAARELVDTERTAVDRERIERVEITMPRMIGTQEAVHDILKSNDVPVDLTDETVFVLARNLSTVTYLVCDELIRILQMREAKEIVLIGTPSDFGHYMFEAAQSRGYKNIRIGDSMDLRVGL